MPDEHEKRVKIQRSKPSISREQRAGLFLVIASGFFALILGVLFLFDQLTDPFQIQYEGPRFLTTEQEEQEALLEQQQMDTDGDTLTDYDELYIFRTSPYLSDTDGDGYSDYAELQASTDPTCAAGRDCEDVYEIGGAGQEVLSGYLNTLSSSGEAVDDIASLLQTFNASDVRQLLVEAGVPEAQLAEISDEDLETLYRSVLGDLEESGELQTIIEQTLEEQAQ